MAAATTVCYYGLGSNCVEIALTMVVVVPKDTRILPLELKGFGRLGEALAEFEGKQVFVFGGIPGELVQAEIIREHRRYVTARVVKVIHASPHRILPPCPYFGRCTGCQWQHIAYDYQLYLKAEIVKDALKRVGGISDVVVEQTIPSPDQWKYRNHARFTVGPEGRLGFVNRETREFVNVEECLLMASSINDRLQELQGMARETTQLSIRCGVNTGSLLVQPTLHEPTLPFETGQKFYEEELLGKRFRVASPSFFQVNSRQAEGLALLLRDSLKLTGKELLVDAYSGVGTFAILLSSYVKTAIAIEESSSAMEDALVNSSAENNVELRKGKVEDTLFSLGQDEIDVVVLDPSRSGCHPSVLQTLIQVAPKNIAYISCDPETLARDLSLLLEGPFCIDRIQPLDMFPHTHHVECLATLRLDVRRQGILLARQGLTLASGSPRRRRILEDFGVKFQATTVDFEEPPGRTPSSNPVDFVQTRALNKGLLAAKNVERGTIIGADTIVTLDDMIFGKPIDIHDAETMLGDLRGREHTVMTALALVDAETGQTITGYRTSRVFMREYSDQEIEAYLETGDSLDKAGAYAIQNEGFHPVLSVLGCYLNVVGLPLCTLVKLLKRFGVHLNVAPFGLDIDFLNKIRICHQCSLIGEVNF